MHEQVDVLAELECLIQARTCEVCGDVWSETLPHHWKCRSEKKNGYTSKHWRNWRLCPNCLCKLSAIGFGGFDKFVFPVIANVPDIQLLADQLVAVQPMQGPAPGMFYLDYRIGTGGVQRTERREGRVVREDRIVRGRTRHTRTLVG